MANISSTDIGNQYNKNRPKLQDGSKYTLDYQRQIIHKLFYGKDFRDRIDAGKELFFYGSGSIVSKVLKISYKTDSNPTVKLNSLELYKLSTSRLFSQ